LGVDELNPKSTHDFVLGATDKKWWDASNSRTMKMIPEEIRKKTLSSDFASFYPFISKCYDHLADCFLITPDGTVLRKHHGTDSGGLDTAADNTITNTAVSLFLVLPLWCLLHGIDLAAALLNVFLKTHGDDALWKVVEKFMLSTGFTISSIAPLYELFGFTCTVEQELTKDFTIVKYIGITSSWFEPTKQYVPLFESDKMRAAIWVRNQNVLSEALLAKLWAIAYMQFTDRLLFGDCYSLTMFYLFNFVPQSPLAQLYFRLWDLPRNFLYVPRERRLQLSGGIVPEDFVTSLFGAVDV